MTIATLIDDIELRIYKGLSDDREIERSQIAWWVKISRDSIVKQYLDSLLQAGKPIDSTYVTRETCKVEEEEVSDCADECSTRWFFETDEKPLSLFNDLGIVRVETNEGLTVLRSRVESISLLNDLKYSKPTKWNLTWYRDGDKVIISGLREPENAEFNVYYVASSENLGETDEIKLSTDLTPMVIEAVEQIAQRELGGIQDRTNNGEDELVNSKRGNS